MARTTIRTEDITAGEVTTAKMATDPTNASNLSSGSVPSARLGNVDLTGLEDDVALLGFRVASNGSLAKYNLVDQTVDDFQDSSGINTGSSTNESRDTSGKYVHGESTVAGNPTGGTTSEYTDGSTYWVNTFLSGDDYVVPSSGSVDYLVVAGGGSGGSNIGGGGGAGGVLTGTSHAVTAQTYTITVGAGGSGAAKTNGANSVFDSFTSIGGGGGGKYDASDNAIRSGALGGSGGGGTGHGGGPGTGGAGTAGQGSAGGTGVFGGTYQAAGGGGKAAVGGDGSAGGDAGVGVSYDLDGTAYFYGGGGGGGAHPGYNGGDGGNGGGGAGGNNPASGGSGRNAGGDASGASAGAAGANTGGGGGGAGAGGGYGVGGSGIVILRVVKDSMTTTAPANLTLISATTAAQAAPTKGDIVFTYTNGAGSTTLGTDVTAEISADGGSTWTAMTLGSEGSTGSHNIATAHDVTISSTITSPWNMAYRIKTLNQSASKTTRIQAVSLGWS